MKADKRLAALLSALAALSLCACAGENEALPDEPLPDYTGNLRISELMIKNDATLLSPNGRFSDWVELENTFGAQLSLDGWQLSADGDSWSFPKALLEPGERLLVFCDKDAAHAPPGGRILRGFCPLCRGDLEAHRAGRHCG